jgi:hypothetical protein
MPNEQQQLTEDELIEMRWLIRMSQLARILWSVVVGLIGLAGSVYVLADHFYPHK